MNKEQAIETKLMPRDLAHLQAILDIKGEATVRRCDRLDWNRDLGIDYIIEYKDKEKNPIYIDIKTSDRYDFAKSYYFETRTQYCDTGHVINSWAYAEHTKLKNHFTVFSYPNRIVIIPSISMRYVLKNIDKRKFKYKKDFTYRGEPCIKESCIIGVNDRELLSKLHITIYDFLQEGIRKGSIEYLMELERLLEAYMKAVDESFTTKDYTKVAQIREQLEALNRFEELEYRADLMLSKSDDPDIKECMDSVKKRV